jgi:hypothetical protein
VAQNVYVFRHFMKFALNCDKLPHFSGFYTIAQLLEAFEERSRCEEFWAFRLVTKNRP